MIKAASDHNVLNQFSDWDLWQIPWKYSANLGREKCGKTSSFI